MSEVDIIVENTYLDALLKELHKNGIMQIEDVSSSEKDYLELIEKSSTPEEVKDIAGMLIKLEELLADFEMGEKGPKASIKEMLFPPIPPKMPVKRRSFDELKMEYSRVYGELWGKVESLATGISQSEELIDRKSKQISELEIMKVMDINLSDVGEGAYVTVRVGEVRDPAQLKREMAGIERATYEMKTYFESKKVQRYVVAVIYCSALAPKASSALRKAGFQDFDTEGLRGSPEDSIRTLLREIEALKKKIKAMRKEMSQIASSWKLRIEALMEELEIEKNRAEAVSNMGRTQHTSVISGWTPRKEEGRLEKLVSTVSGKHALVFFSGPSDNDRVPVKMKNPGWARPFEFLTNMFARPKYNELDPTAIIAPLFVIFFGLMLGDALYGLIITIGGIIILKGLGKVDEAMRDFGTVITLAGISTVIFGMVQGGYFGPFNDQAPNLLQRLGISEVPVLIDSMKDPITMLVIGLMIGLAHLNLGLFLGALQNIREGRKKEALLQQGTWWVLQPGSFVLIAGKLFGWYEYSPTTYTIATVLVIVGLIMLIMQEKGMFFFGITGFLGNFLSYARILALGLGTAGIALTVNILTDLVVDGATPSLAPVCGSLAAIGAIFGIISLKKPRKRYKITGALLLLFGVVGFISVPAAFMLLGAIVYIFGHLINTGLQALGSFVHSLRLQYVEFFGYFYEGGGREFKPYAEKRKITEVKEVHE